MNVIDLIVCLVLALALWNGWRQGFIVQVCSLAAIVLGIWLAARYGAQVGAWLRLDARFEAAGGFAAVLVATVLAVAIAARVLRKLFHFAGFGLPDILLGIAVPVVTDLPVLSALVAAFARPHAHPPTAARRRIHSPRSYKPLLRLSESLFPFLEWVGEQVPQLDAKDSDGEEL